LTRLSNNELVQGANALNSNVEALELLIKNNFPNHIQEMFWGLTSKIIPMGNFDSHTAEFLESQMDKIEGIWLTEIPDDEITNWLWDGFRFDGISDGIWTFAGKSRYDPMLWPQIRSLMKVIVSLGQGGALLNRTTSMINQYHPEVQQAAQQAAQKDWGAIMFGAGGNDSFTPDNLNRKW
jgi:hypothetical protein